MAVPDLNALTADEVLALPLPDLGLAVLVVWWDTNEYSGLQLVKKLEKRLGKEAGVKRALLEGLHWAVTQGYLAPDLNNTSHTHYFVTRLGKQALGLGA